MLLHDIITRSAAVRPKDVAVIFREQSMTYGELAVMVTRLSAGFAAIGVRPGAKIGLLLPNCPPFVWAYFAASQMGAVVVPVNPLLKPAELEYIWRDAGVTLVVTVAPLLPLVQAARQNLPALTQIVCATPQAELPDPALASLPGLSFLADVIAEGAKAAEGKKEEKKRRREEEKTEEGEDTRHKIQDTREAVPSSFSENDFSENNCAVIIYTSGTTGHPKGAMLSHKNLTRNVEQIQVWLRFLPNDRFLTVIPLFHAFAATVCMNTSLMTGCATILLENFVPLRTLETIEKHRATILPAVPAVFNALLAAAPERPIDTSSLRVLVSGGAPLPIPTLDALEQRFGVPVIEGDGPTECSPVTSVNPLEGVRKAGSVGPALPDVEVAIWDEQNSPLPTDDIGEIVVRGDNVMLGYLNQPDATQEAMTGGWYHTGDLGKMDADGYIFILDRKKDMIITAGLNVYPREVEEVLLMHEGVADAAVIGQPDALRGEDVLAVVVRKPDVEPPVGERDLIRYCRERLANYKTPRRVLFRDTLPRGGTGKVVKRLLKKELEMEPSERKI